MPAESFDEFIYVADPVLEVSDEDTSLPCITAKERQTRRDTYCSLTSKATYPNRNRQAAS
jgi:hypothetical protein